MTANRLALLALAAAAGATAWVSLATLGRLKDAYIAAVLRGQRAGPGELLRALGPLDLLPVLLAVAAVGGLVWLELRRRACTRLLATATGAEAFLLLTILAAWFAHSYLGAGVLLGGDTATHVSRFLEVSRGLDEGRLALWTNYQYGGAPLLWFTGPFTYVVGGGIAFLLRDAMLTLKLLLFGATVLSGWLFYAFLRRLDVRAMASALGAAAFAGSFAHLHMFLYRGVAPQAFTILFLVMLFLSADGLMRGRGSRWSNVLVFGLATAASIVNHQPHGLFAAVYLGVFGGVALLTGFWPWRGLPVLVAAGALGTAASVVAVVPLLVEADWVMIEPTEGFLRFRLPAAERLAKLLLWRNSGGPWGSDYWAYLGLGPIVFAAAGVAGLLGRRIPAGAALPALACFGVSLVLYNPVVRDIMFLLFFVAMLAAFGIDWLLDRVAASPGLGGRGLLAVVGVALLDLASTSVQPVTRTDKGFLIEAGRRLERIAPGQRVMQVHLDAGGAPIADTGPAGVPASYEATVQRIAGNHNMGATRLHNPIFATTKLVQEELAATGRLSAQSRTMLGVFNVGRLICNSSAANGCPASFADTEEDPVFGRYVPVLATPALFSRQVAGSPAMAGLDKPALWATDYLGPGKLPRVAAIEDAMRDFLALEEVDLAAGRAGTIALRDPPAERQASPDGEWQAALREYAVGLDRVTMRVEADAPGWVQLSHPWFPSTRVTLNGVRVEPLRGALNLMVLPISAGSSTIELREGWTVVRMASLLASLFALAGLLGFAAVLAGRDRRPG